MREGVKQKLELPSEDNSLFNENSLFDSGYCVEFVLQLMRGEQYSQRFNLSRFISDLEDFGSSIVAVQDEKRVKVHIHTFKPGKVLSLSQEFGELVVCKVENMQLQHNSRLSPPAEAPKEKKKLAFVAAADGGWIHFDFVPGEQNVRRVSISFASAGSSAAPRKLPGSSRRLRPTG